MEPRNPNLVSTENIGPLGVGRHAEVGMSVPLRDRQRDALVQIVLREPIRCRVRYADQLVAGLLAGHHGPNHWARSTRSVSVVREY